MLPSKVDRYEVIYKLLIIRYASPCVIGLRERGVRFGRAADLEIGRGEVSGGELCESKDMFSRWVVTFDAGMHVDVAFSKRLKKMAASSDRA